MRFRKRICVHGHDKSLPHGVYIFTHIKVVNGKAYTYFEYRCAVCERHRKAVKA